MRLTVPVLYCNPAGVFDEYHISLNQTVLGQNYHGKGGEKF